MGGFVGINPVSRLNDFFKEISRRCVEFGWRHCIFLVLQLIFAVWAIRLWIHVPQAGWSVAIMAAVAAAMSVHGEMRGWQKAVWMILICVLLIVELRAISKDRRDAEKAALQDRQRQDTEFKNVLKAQNDDFKATSTGLETAISNSNTQFSATMAEAGKLFGKTTEAANAASKAVREATGEDSFAYLEFSGYPPLDARVVKIGDAPLYDVSVTVNEVTHCPPSLRLPMTTPSMPCTSTMGLASKELGNFPVGTDLMELSDRAQFRLAKPPPFSEGGPGDLDHVSLQIEIEARNGKWTEMFWARRRPDSTPHAIHEEIALRVYKQIYDTHGMPKGLQLIHSEGNSDYPKDLMEFDPKPRPR